MKTHEDESPLKLLLGEGMTPVPHYDHKIYLKLHLRRTIAAQEAPEGN